MAELAEVDGGLLPLIAVGVGLGALCIYWKANEPKGITNFELLGITPPK